MLKKQQNPPPPDISCKPPPPPGPPESEFIQAVVRAGWGLRYEFRDWVMETE